MKKLLVLVILGCFLLGMIYLVQENYEKESYMESTDNMLESNIYDGTYEFVEVIDGDTIKVKDNSGNIISVRMIGLDSPESTATRHGYIECFGLEAKNHLKYLLSGVEYVFLEKDNSQGDVDKYGRTLAYIFSDGINLNYKMIGDGYGREYTYEQPYKYQSMFKKAMNNAKINNIGLWNDSTCNGERQAIGERDELNNTGNIKGNISRKGEKIYHTTSCSHYNKTIINLSKGEKWFSTESEAKVAGWRPCFDG